MALWARSRQEGPPNPLPGSLPTAPGSPPHWQGAPYAPQHLEALTCRAGGAAVAAAALGLHKAGWGLPGCSPAAAPPLLRVLGLQAVAGEEPLLGACARLRQGWMLSSRSAAAAPWCLLQTQQAGGSAGCQALVPSTGPPPRRPPRPAAGLQVASFLDQAGTGLHSEASRSGSSWTSQWRPSRSGSGGGARAHTHNTQHTPRSLLLVCSLSDPSVNSLSCLGFYLVSSSGQGPFSLALAPLHLNK